MATTKARKPANLGFEAKLWAAADALRNYMDAAEYKHVVLGLKAANTVLSPLIDRGISARIESRTLAAVRDSLLPRLISGELRVKDAGRVVEPAAMKATSGGA